MILKISVVDSNPRPVDPKASVLPITPQHPTNIHDGWPMRARPRSYPSMDLECLRLVQLIPNKISVAAANRKC